MPTIALVQARLEELITRGEQIKATGQTSKHIPGIASIQSSWVDEERAYQWTISAMTILESTFGASSEIFQAVKKRLPACSDYTEFCRLIAIMRAALEDLMGGYFFNAKALLEAEICCDLIEQAEQLLTAGYHAAAAVIAGSVLEQHMRSVCISRHLDHVKPNGKYKMINDLNDELAKAGVYNSFKKKQVTAWADLRNNAAHGNSSAFNPADVAPFIQALSSFCAEVK